MRYLVIGQVDDGPVMRRLVTDLRLWLAWGRFAKPLMEGKTIEARGSDGHVRRVTARKVAR